ncbi:MAG TPA: hypothetical protein P5048_01455, partial [Chlamydiales bacterium]|nr:hypothetical protein [Chlamydiales bacterium]
FIGLKQTILIEQTKEKQNRFSGRLENFALVSFCSKTVYKPNDSVKLQVIKMRNNQLEGSVI